MRELLDKYAADDGSYRHLNNVKNVQWYVDIIQSLRQYVEDDQFRSIVGVRFAQWLDEQE